MKRNKKIIIVMGKLSMIRENVKIDMNCTKEYRGNRNNSLGCKRSVEKNIEWKQMAMEG